MVEAFAACTGILGSLLLASKSPSAKFGWYVYLASNLSWIAFSLSTGHWWLAAQSTAFLATSLLGIKNHVLNSKHANTAAA